MPCSIALVVAGGFIVGDDQQAGVFKQFACEQRAENILQPVVSLPERAGVAASRVSLVAAVGALNAVAVVKNIRHEKGIVGETVLREVFGELRKLGEIGALRGRNV